MIKIENDTILINDYGVVMSQIKDVLCGLFSKGFCVQQKHWAKNEEVH